MTLAAESRMMLRQTLEISFAASVGVITLLLLLKSIQRSGQPKSCGVEVLPPRFEGEQKGAGFRDLITPRR